MSPHFNDNLPLANTVFGSVTKASVFNCSAQGIPPPHITWFKDEKILKASKHLNFLENKQVLEIKRVEESDAGLYFCSVSNHAGVVSRNFSFEITG